MPHVREYDHVQALASSGNTQPFIRLNLGCISLVLQRAIMSWPEPAWIKLHGITSLTRCKFYFHDLVSLAAQRIEQALLFSCHIYLLLQTCYKIYPRSFVFAKLLSPFELDEKVYIRQMERANPILEGPEDKSATSNNAISMIGVENMLLNTSPTTSSVGPSHISRLSTLLVTRTSSATVAKSSFVFEKDLSKLSSRYHCASAYNADRRSTPGIWRTTTSSQLKSKYGRRRRSTCHYRVNPLALQDHYR